MHARAQRWLVLASAVLAMALQPAPAAGQDEDRLLEGEFAVTIAAEDVPPELIDGASLIGRWTLVFDRDGAYSRGRQDVGTLASGRFETSGSRVSLSGEMGLLACPALSDGAADAIYEWALSGDRLQLVAIEEPCAVRRLLLTTRTLAIFVACEPDALEAGVATPTPPRATPMATPDADSATGEEIDAVLRRMSSCWATREPERFLPLLSAEFRAELVANDEENTRRFSLRMGAPIVWDRAGEVESLGDGRVAVAVRQTAGDEIDLLRYLFVFENGAWRWAGPAEGP